MLEEFSKLNSDSDDARLKAGTGILSHLSQNEQELEYAVKRLVRGLESQKVPMRTGSYTTLAALLGIRKLEAVRLRELVASILVTDKQTTTKERRLVYVARILASGAIIRTLPLSSILENEGLLKGILTDLVELGRRRSTLMELAAPFICHVLNDEEMTAGIFENIVWPCLQPLFCKIEIKIDVETEDESEPPAVAEKDTNISALHIALTCSERGLKTDFKFLNDVNQLVRILLSQANRVTNIDQIVELIISTVKKNELAEEFWDVLVPQIRSSHFDTVCICVQKSIKGGIPHNIVAREEIVVPLLGVFKNDEASEQHSKAISTLEHLLKWNNTKESEMSKKERKTVAKTLFGGSPNLLHEYKSLLKILKPFLAEICTKKDLNNLVKIVDKKLNEESGVSVRMGVVYLQFLSRVAQSKKANSSTMADVCKKLLKVGFGSEKLVFAKTQRKLGKEKDTEEEDDEKDVQDDDDEESEALVKKCCIDSLHSVLSSAYNPEFMDEILTFVLEELDSFTQDAGIKKTIKKVDKLRTKGDNQHVRYILGAYALRLLLDQDNILAEAKTDIEEAINMHKAASKNDSSSEIIQFILNCATKNTQPPFDFESMFARLVIEDNVSEAGIQAFADVIDVEIDEDAEDEEDSEDESSDEEEVVDVKSKLYKQNGMPDENDDEEENEEETTPRKLTSTKKNKSKSKTEKNMDESDDDSDGLSSVDMDEATEEDLKMMDDALAKVFATKKKVKEEESYEVRSLMRTFRLLETLLTRKSKLCHVSIPLMLLMPIIHSLQNSIRGKKSNNLSTRIVTVLNKLNAIKKFEGVDDVETGSLLTMARDVSSSMKNVRNKMIADLLGDSVILLTKCYLQRSEKTKGEDVGFTTLYTGMLDLSNDSRNKSMAIVSNVISSALTLLPNWKEGKDAVCKRLFEIIFDPEVRMFRRLQFAVLLRAALADTTHSTEKSSFNEWKVKAMKELSKKSLKYFSNCTITMKNLTAELLMTFRDAKNEESLCKIVEDFVTKATNDSAVFNNLNSVCVGKLRVLLKSVGLCGDEEKSGKKEKRKINGVVNAVELLEKESPKKKKSKKAK